ncbi:MAG: flagellar motor protein MotB, partial [Rhodospirillales bacterium]|nr:flagellar motor protein MotB [Rhodospirillales bacterium]
MSRRRGNGGNGLEAWPGYVDALSTLLMVTIFVLLVFVLAEAFLSTALTGSDNTINVLKQQIAELTQSLSMETSKDTSLTQELAALNAQLATAQAANTSLNQQLATDTTTISGLQTSQKSLQDQLSDAQAEAASAAGRIAALQTADGGDLQSQLTSAQSLNKQDAAQIALL